MAMFDWEKFSHILSSRHLTARVLARRIGCSDNALSLIRRGKVQPRNETVERIEKALSLEAGALDKTRAQALEVPAVDSERELLMAFRRLPPRRQSRVIGYAQGLAVSEDEGALEFGGRVREALEHDTKSHEESD